MTYEEYKSSKNGSSKKSIIKVILGKVFTVAIFVLIVVIISNISPKFRTFVTDKVLDSTIDFSFVNKFTSKITDVFKKDNVVPVSATNEKHELYKDGYKYYSKGEVKLKESGIVTFIGNKEGYNNTVVVQQSNGYYAWYGNVNESVKLYDYIEEGSTVGESNEYYYYVLLKDDKPVLINNES